jgi:hypothetical protein
LYSLFWLLTSLDADLNGHPPDDGIVEVEITAFDRFWQSQFLGTGRQCTQASDIGAPSAEKMDFVVIQTHLSFGF